MSVYNLAWAVVLVPLGALAASYVIESARRAAWVCVGGTVVSLGLAIIVLSYRLGHVTDNPHQAAITFWTYAPGQQLNGQVSDFHPQVGILVDGLSALVMTVVVLVTLLVQVYSLHYLRNDAGLRRYFVVTSGFLFTVLGVVVSPNLFQTLLMWWAISAGSLLLVGHWWHRPAGAAAAKRLMVVMGGGDLVLMLGVVVAFTKLAPDVGLLPPTPSLPFNDPFNFPLLGVEWQRILNGAVAGAGTRTLVFIACLVLVAALVKSALPPFSGWLVGATEGPTPALALVCAAGPVGAGVYLVARTYPLFLAAPHVLTAVAVVGAVGAVYGAAGALASTDIKRLTAFAVVAQAGLAFVALGVGDLSAAVLVAVALAWSAGLLMLAAGNVISAYGTQDIREMGGVRRLMPTTAACLLVGCLSAGMVLPLTGFWAADSVVAGILRNSFANGGHVSRAAQGVVLVVTCAAIVLLAAASLRLFALVVLGEPSRRRGFVADRVRESAGPMIAPVLALAVLAAAGGLAAFEGGPKTFLKLLYGADGAPALGFSGAAFALTALPALLGAGAGVMLGTRRVTVPATLAGLAGLAASGFALESATMALAARAAALLAPLPGRVDTEIVDEVVGGVGDAAELLGEGALRLRPSRFGAQLVGGTAAALVVAGAVTLAATGHLPGVGASR